MQISTRHCIRKWACGLTTAAAIASANGTPCTPIEQAREGNYPGARIFDAFRISKPGQYCLSQDITSKRVFATAEGGERAANGPIGFVGASGVDIDFRGHALAADSLGTWGMDAGDTTGRLITDIALHDGTIVSRTNGGVLLNGLFSFQLDQMVLEYFAKSPKLSNHSLFEKNIFKERLTWLRSPEDRDVFPNTNYRLERLRIEANNWAGIELKGGSNTVRGNTISVNRVSGLVVWGPRQVIENNTIVFKGKPAAPNDAPIKLHLADNSIIRNNTIVIEGWGDKPDAAISIIDSKNVVIENNKIIGVKQLYKIWDEEPDQKSSVVEHGNEFASGWSRLFGK